MTRIGQFLHKHVVVQAVQAIAWVLTLFAVGIGTSLIVAPAEIVYMPSFAHTFTFAPPHVWGIGFVALGAWAGVTLAKNPAGSPMPLAALAVLTGAWGISTLPAVAEQAGGITAIWAYSALAASCLIVSLSISHQERS